MNIDEHEPGGPRGFLSELWDTLWHPGTRFSLTVLLEGVALAVFLFGVLYAIVFQTLFIEYHVLVASLVAPALALVLASRGLRFQGVGSERIFIGLSAAVSGLWLFEILYHYSYPGSLMAFPTNLKTLRTNTGVGNYFPLPWSLIMVVLPAVAYRRMSINPFFLVLLAATVVSFFLWTEAGYPQFPFATGRLAFVAAVYNSIAKGAVCLVPASLFLPTELLERSPRKKSDPPDDRPAPSQ